ncbi:hypothetical protein P4T89_13090 [Bacillus nakamurai]|uniref:Uncharacterized protein n=1 Tax=Bacillus nakamurai TaxID=1793963 RepID=A0A150FAT0_9BACI|nr:hypothetical protein [Bacillus nakamurai]KXZ22326.1 hypothetical protein AXI58_10060 [Bacillus nakamurai]MED1228451.1 hypothetical protein [Bacillus nakamurai]
MENKDFIEENIGNCLSKLSELRKEGNHPAYKTVAKSLCEYMKLINTQDMSEIKYLANMNKLISSEIENLKTFIATSFNKSDFKAYHSLSCVFGELSRTLGFLRTSLRLMHKKLSERVSHYIKED